MDEGGLVLHCLTVHGDWVTYACFRSAIVSRFFDDGLAPRAARVPRFGHCARSVRASDVVCIPRIAIR